MHPLLNSWELDQQVHFTASQLVGLSHEKLPCHKEDLEFSVYICAGFLRSRKLGQESYEFIAEKLSLPTRYLVMNITDEALSEFSSWKLVGSRSEETVDTFKNLRTACLALEQKKPSKKNSTLSQLFVLGFCNNLRRGMSAPSLLTWVRLNSRSSTWIYKRATEILLDPRMSNRLNSAIKRYSRHSEQPYIRVPSDKRLIFILALINIFRGSTGSCGRLPKWLCQLGFGLIKELHVWPLLVIQGGKSGLMGTAVPASLDIHESDGQGGIHIITAEGMKITPAFQNSVEQAYKRALQTWLSQNNRLNAIQKRSRESLVFTFDFTDPARTRNRLTLPTYDEWCWTGRTQTENLYKKWLKNRMHGLRSNRPVYVLDDTSAGAYFYQIILSQISSQTMVPQGIATGAFKQSGRRHDGANELAVVEGVSQKLAYAANAGIPFVAIPTRPKENEDIDPKALEKQQALYDREMERFRTLKKKISSPTVFEAIRTPRKMADVLQSVHWRRITISRLPHLRRKFHQHLMLFNADDSFQAKRTVRERKKAEKLNNWLEECGQEKGWSQPRLPPLLEVSYKSLDRFARKSVVGIQSAMQAVALWLAYIDEVARQESDSALGISVLRVDEHESDLDFYRQLFDILSGSEESWEKFRFAPTIGTAANLLADLLTQKNGQGTSPFRPAPDIVVVFDERHREPLYSERRMPFHCRALFKKLRIVLEERGQDTSRAMGCKFLYIWGDHFYPKFDLAEKWQELGDKSASVPFFAKALSVFKYGFSREHISSFVKNAGIKTNLPIQDTLEMLIHENLLESADQRFYWFEPVRKYLYGQLSRPEKYRFHIGAALTIVPSLDVKSKGGLRLKSSMSGRNRLEAKQHLLAARVNRIVGDQIANAKHNSLHSSLTLLEPNLDWPEISLAGREDGTRFSALMAAEHLFLKEQVAGNRKDDWAGDRLSRLLDILARHMRRRSAASLAENEYFSQALRIRMKEAHDLLNKYTNSNQHPIWFTRLVSTVASIEILRDKKACSACELTMSETERIYIEKSISTVDRKFVRSNGINAIWFETSDASLDSVSNSLRYSVCAAVIQRWHDPFLDEKLIRIGKVIAQNSLPEHAPETLAQALDAYDFYLKYASSLKPNSGWTYELKSQLPARPFVNRYNDGIPSAALHTFYEDAANAGIGLIRAYLENPRAYHNDARTALDNWLKYKIFADEVIVIQMMTSDWNFLCKWSKGKSLDKARTELLRRPSFIANLVERKERYTLRFLGERIDPENMEIGRTGLYSKLILPPPYQNAGQLMVRAGQKMKHIRWQKHQDDHFSSISKQMIKEGFKIKASKKKVQKRKHA